MRIWASRSMVTATACIMVDAAGTVYDGDQLLYIIAKHRRQRGMLRGGVVGTQMSNLGLEHALHRLGILSHGRRSGIATCSRS